jgi:hypothetical protein
MFLSLLLLLLLINHSFFTTLPAQPTSTPYLPSSASTMSKRVFTPVNQIKLTNVAIVRLKRGGKVESTHTRTHTHNQIAVTLGLMASDNIDHDTINGCE